MILVLKNIENILVPGIKKILIRTYKWRNLSKPKPTSKKLSFTFQKCARIFIVVFGENIQSRDGIERILIRPSKEYLPGSEMEKKALYNESIFIRSKDIYHC